MLAHLDALCAALLARNAIEIYRLLGLPEARKLPRVVREEAIAIAKAGPESYLAPVQALHLYYKLSHLVDESAQIDEPDERAGRTNRPRGSGNGVRAKPLNPQMEIPFRGRRKVG